MTGTMSSVSQSTCQRVPIVGSSLVRQVRSIMWGGGGGGGGG